MAKSWLNPLDGTCRVKRCCDAPSDIVTWALGRVGANKWKWGGASEAGSTSSAVHFPTEASPAVTIAVSGTNWK